MLPLAVLVLAGWYYVLAVKTPTYEAAATYILVDPPAPPISVQMTGSDNPYLRFSNDAVLVEVLATRLTSEQGRRRLASQGADPNYTAQSNTELGFSAPILQVTGTGTTPAAAIRTAYLVGRAMTAELARMQGIRRVEKRYRIRAAAVVAAHDATLKGAGRIRGLLAVFALGAILMFVLISFLDAVGALRSQRVGVKWPQPAHR
jgi:hypothetical protein